MHIEPDAQEDIRKIAAALRRKIREKGLTYPEVEDRAGMGRDYLRHVFAGKLRLRIEHVVNVLRALGIPPVEFWIEVYGPPPSRLYADSPDHHSFATTVRVMHRSLLRRMIWKLEEKGVFNSDEATGMLEELEQTGRLAEPPL